MPASLTAGANPLPAMSSFGAGVATDAKTEVQASTKAAEALRMGEFMNTLSAAGCGPQNISAGFLCSLSVLCRVGTEGRSQRGNSKPAAAHGCEMHMTEMDELTFKRATQEDVKELLVLMDLLYEHDGQSFDVAHALRATSELILTPEAGTIWLLQSERRTVGYCVLTFGFSIEFHGRDALVDELFLLPTQRGKGWGKLALEFMFQQCRAAGVEAVHVDVNLVNEHAAAVYRHLGFVQPDRRRMTKWI